MTAIKNNGINQALVSIGACLLPYGSIEEILYADGERMPIETIVYMKREKILETLLKEEVKTKMPGNINKSAIIRREEKCGLANLIASNDEYYCRIQCRP